MVTGWSVDGRGARAGDRDRIFEERESEGRESAFA
jgi:hypothetical protein